MKLRVAPSTERYLQQFAVNLPHALLLTGQQGVGLSSLAESMARANGTLHTILRPESKSTAVATISVDMIRQLYVDTKTKMHGKNFVIIDDSDRMNHSAQNALLKLLEEPNDSICFILTSHHPDKLLPTIRSRAQLFAVAPISAIESRRLLKSLGVTDDLALQRMLYVAEGLPAELSRLAANTTDFTKLLERVQVAKEFVEGSSYQRLAASLKSGTDRQDVIRTIEMALLLLRRSLAAKPEKETLEAIDRLIRASELIRANGNIKLQLARAMLQ